MEIIHRPTRRELLTIGSAFLLNACRQPNIPSVPDRQMIPTAAPITVTPNDRLIQIINSLPNSSMKDLLNSHVIPIYTRRINSIQYGNTAPIPIYDPIITHTVVPNSNFIGVYSPNQPAPGKSLFSMMNSQPSEVHVVLKDILTEQEASTFPQTNTGLPVASLKVAANTGFTVGIYPNISITTPRMHPTQSEADEQYIYIKEACSLLATNLWFMSVSNYSEQTGLALNIVNQEGNHNLLPYIAQRFTSSKGRLIASLDLAAYILSIKAFEGTNILPFIIQKDPRYLEITRIVTATDLGTQPLSIIRNSLRLAITDPTVRILDHSGDITDISNLRIRS